MFAKKEGEKYSYEGESSRSGFIRMKEHVKDLEKKRKKSVLFKHVSKEHEEEEDTVNFSMKITGHFSKCITRQLDEGIRIRDKNPKYLLNSKSEFYAPSIKRKVFDH